MAGFPLRSYAPGEPAPLTLATDAPRVAAAGVPLLERARSRLQDGRNRQDGTAGLDWSSHRDRAGHARLRPSRRLAERPLLPAASADDGRLGYAPFIVRPQRLGATSRIAVVLATNTWQAYNFWDADGDGWGDSWYVSGSVRSVDLRRPYLDFGVPFRFRDWDLDFIGWLNRTDKRVEFLSDDDLERFANGDELARAYDLIVFPGHEEYVTRRAYDLVQRYRDRGGNLLFLAANNFFWRVDRDGERLRRVRVWRELRRPSRRSSACSTSARTTAAARRGTSSPQAGWPFEGTGLARGDVFGRYGIEIDARTTASPPGTRVLASIPDLMGVGRTAEMTYYESPGGAKVFAAGALNFAASVGDPAVSRLLENVWARLSRP